MNDDEALTFAKRVLESAWADLPMAHRSLLESIGADEWSVTARPLGSYADGKYAFKTRRRDFMPTSRLIPTPHLPKKSVRGWGCLGMGRCREWRSRTYQTARLSSEGG
jgi:hypothetical protein